MHRIVGNFDLVPRRSLLASSRAFPSDRYIEHETPLSCPIVKPIIAGTDLGSRDEASRGVGPTQDIKGFYTRSLSADWLDRTLESAPSSERSSAVGTSRDQRAW